MEKIKKLFLLMAILIPAIAFTACSDDDEPEANNELVGTTWTCIDNDTEHGYYSLETLSFKSGSKCVYTMIEKEDGVTVTDFSINGTYTFNPPVVIISMSYEGENATMNLTVSDNKMISKDGYTFTRQ